MMRRGELFACTEDRRHITPWEFVREAQPIECALPGLGAAMFRTQSELVMRSLLGIIQILPRSSVLWRWEHHQQMVRVSSAFGVPVLPSSEGLVRGRRWRIDDADWTRVAEALSLSGHEFACQFGLRPRLWARPPRQWLLDEAKMLRVGRLLEEREW
jgi:hypothetical protein